MTTRALLTTTLIVALGTGLPVPEDAVVPEDALMTVESGYLQRWKDAKAVFEFTAGCKKPAPGSSPCFPRFGTGIEDTLKLWDKGPTPEKAKAIKAQLEARISAWLHGNFAVRLADEMLLHEDQVQNQHSFEEHQPGLGLLKLRDELLSIRYAITEEKQLPLLATVIVGIPRTLWYFAIASNIGFGRTPADATWYPVSFPGSRFEPAYFLNRDFSFDNSAEAFNQNFLGAFGRVFDGVAWDRERLNRLITLQCKDGESRFQLARIFRQLSNRRELMMHSHSLGGGFWDSHVGMYTGVLVSPSKPAGLNFVTRAALKNATPLFHDGHETIPADWFRKNTVERFDW